jgi:hypothetical protein
LKSPYRTSCDYFALRITEIGAIPEGSSSLQGLQYGFEVGLIDEDQGIGKTRIRHLPLRSAPRIVERIAGAARNLLVHRQFRKRGGLKGHAALRNRRDRPAIILLEKNILPSDFLHASDQGVFPARQVFPRLRIPG